LSRDKERDDRDDRRAALERATALSGEAAALRARLDALSGPVAVLKRVLSVQIETPLEGLARSLRGGADASEAGDKPRAAVAHLGQRLYALGIVIEARAHAAGAALLGDADAVADALLRPLRDHARTLGYAAFNERVVCMPTSPGFEAVLLGLFEAHPVVFTPPDFGENLHRWASIAHELGHIVWHRWPGFAVEARSQLGLNRRPSLPLRGPDGTYRSRVEDALAGWLEEMHADLFAVVLLGPAAARSLAACFAVPEAPERAREARTLDGQTYAPHPPATLRVLWAAHALRRQGFAADAQAVERAWKSAHGDAAHLVIPLSSQRVAEVALAPFLDVGCALIDAYLDRAWASLGGATLGGVPGLELGPGRQAQVAALAQALISGTAQTRDPALLLAAAIEARERAPKAVNAISSALLRSIQGLESGERQAEDPRYVRAEPPTVSDPIRPEDLAAALALGDVLTQRRGRRLSYRSG